MSIIKLPIRFEGSKGEKTLYALFDSGRFDGSTNLSCIHEDFAQEITDLIAYPYPKRLATASEHHFIEIESRIVTDFYVEEVQLSDEFLVVPGMSEDAIIGAATMQKWRMKLERVAVAI